MEKENNATSLYQHTREKDTLLKSKHDQIYKLESIYKVQTEFYIHFYSEVEERIRQSSLISLSNKCIHFVTASYKPHEKANFGGKTTQCQGSEGS